MATTATQKSKGKVATMPKTPTAKKSKSKQAAPLSGNTFAQLDIVPEWDQLPELVELDFADYAEARQKLKDEIEFRQKKLKEIDVEIMSRMAAAGTEKVMWEDRPVQIVHSNSGDRIRGEKLLMLGVPADTIAQATETGKPYEYLLFGKPAKS